MVEVYLPYTIAHKLVNIPIHLHTFTYHAKISTGCLHFELCQQKAIRKERFQIPVVCVSMVQDTCMAFGGSKTNTSN